MTRQLYAFKRQVLEKLAMSRRNYSAGTRAALVAFSAGTCYWPACREPLLKKVDGEYMIALDIAHIRALEEGGPRYDATMTDIERNDFPNLLFLCRVHHRKIDKNNGADFPVNSLLEWKKGRETQQQQTLLHAKTPVTAEFLEKAIGDAMSARQEEIQKTLARLERIDAEAAVLMQGLLAELRELRRGSSLVDPDAAAMLSAAAQQLAGLEDWASMLRNAATKLTGLEDTAVRLENAAREARNLQDFM